jgi:hypothetical protein
MAEQAELGVYRGIAARSSLLRVRMRTPDRPGATLSVLESLRTTLQDEARGIDLLRMQDLDRASEHSVLRPRDLDFRHLTTEAPGYRYRLSRATV